VSRRGRPTALPVFWQTLALLLLALMVAQAVALAISFVLPPPRPDFSRLSDLAAGLSGAPVRREGEQELVVTRHARPPSLPAGLVADPQLTRRLAERLNRPADSVRLFAERDHGPGFPFGPSRGGGRGHWRDPILFGQVVAAVADRGGWRVVASPRPPLVSAWQRRILLWFAIAALALLPLAWTFARALSRQIGRFAEAADRVGADPQAPAVAEQGAAELRVAARALNRMQARVREHLAERTAMIGAIAHDLRTPLARVAFRAEAAPEPVRDKILADVAQMQAMISATIGFVRTTGGGAPRRAVDLAALVRALAAQEAELGRPVVPGRLQPATVAGDPLALGRLLQNLVDNAVAYGGGAELALATDNGTAVLTVADRGPGLAPELMERVFQPFVRGDPSRNRATGGIGLGLTSARAVAEDHRGSLALVNRAGGGLEAVLRLPLAAAPLAAVVPAQAGSPLVAT